MEVWKKTRKKMVHFVLALLGQFQLGREKRVGAPPFRGLSDPVARVLQRMKRLSDEEAMARVEAVYAAVGPMVGSVWPFGILASLGLTEGQLWEELVAYAREYLFMYPDAAAFLKGLRAFRHIRVYTATTNPRQVILSKLALGGLADQKGSPWLDDAFGGEEVCVGGKCGPGFYTALLKRVGAEPHRTLVVGDDAKADLGYAREAGIRQVVLPRRQQEEEWCCGVDGGVYVRSLETTLEFLTVCKAAIPEKTNMLSTFAGSRPVSGSTSSAILTGDSAPSHNCAGRRVKRMTKHERVLATLRHQPVDRCAVLEQLSYNPRVIADWTGKPIQGFDYTVDDICEVIRQTCDLVMPPVAPRGTARVTSPDGFVTQCDNWTSWHVSRPFTDAEGARDWLVRTTADIDALPFDATRARADYRRNMLDLQAKIGDTVILNFSWSGFSACFDAMGLEIFTFFQLDYPELFSAYMEASVARELRRIHAVADATLSPVILIPEDFATKQGPIFPPAFLHEFHYPYVRRLTDAWHEHGIMVLYHSDGNWKKVIPDLKGCTVDGFYCLEPNCGMDIVELKTTWPELVWAGGVDGVDLMERGTPEQVRGEVRRHIRETRALETGGMFVASSSEINPPIPPANFRAMVEAVWESARS